jgi:hypothetical protein
MKKMITGLFILGLLGAPLIAQEGTDASTGEAVPVEGAVTAETSGGGQEEAPQNGGGQQMPGMPQPKPNVMAVFGMGTLRIDGMILTGIAAQQDTTLDEDWRLGFINPSWQENRFELDLHYNSGDVPGANGMQFGLFATLWAQNYGIHNFTWNELPIGSDAGMKMNAPDRNQPWVELRYAGFWLSALQDKIKMTVGRTYDEFYYMPGSKVWKTEGYGNPYRFTDEKSISLRMEFKPVKGLNVGFQWFGLPPYAGDESTQRDVEWPKIEEALKEIGLAAEYKHDLFNVLGGVRFDGDADPMDRYEARTYLPGYYGEGGNSVRLWNYNLPTAYLPPIPGMTITSGHSHQGPYYKHLDEVTKVDDEGKLHFEDGTWAFFGFNWKGTENLTAMVHGGLYNIPAFEKFGYGNIAETIGYTIKKLGFGLNMVQQFYGSDVFGDTAVVMDVTTEEAGTIPLASYDIVNSPYFQFIPYITYSILPMGMMSARLDGTIGICKDVLDIEWGIKPSIGLRLGSIMVDIFYQFTQQKYANPFPSLMGKDAAPQTVNTQLVGLGFMMMF